MYCRNCGKQILEEEVFCKYCGAKQPISSYGFEYNNIDRGEQSSKRIVEKMVKKNSNVPRGLLLTLIVVAAFVGLIFSIPSFKSDEQQAKEIVEEFFETVKGGDVNGAMECFTPAFQEQYSGILGASGKLLSTFGLPDVSGLVNPVMGYINQDYYQNYDFEVQTVKLDSESKSGSVDVDVYVDGSYSKTTTINVTKYRGKWYIEN